MLIIFCCQQMLIMNYCMLIDEWKNCLERIKFVPKDEESLKSRMDEIDPVTSTVVAPHAAPTAGHHRLRQHLVHLAGDDSGAKVANPMPSCASVILPLPVPGRNVLRGCVQESEEKASPHCCPSHLFPGGWRNWGAFPVLR